MKTALPGFMILLLTGAAMVAFAANSLLCRMALSPAAIDPAGFAILRLASGALVLFLLTLRPQTGGARPRGRGTWMAAVLLFSYAVAFSYAYVTLNTGTGALILFAAVQVTMFAGAIRSGEPPGRMEYIGLALAMSGLVYLLLPGLQAPPLGGAMLMILAGLSWGWYSLSGRRAGDAVIATRDNFIRTVPFLPVLALFAHAELTVTWSGAMLAVLSGGLASAVGYIIWFSALRYLHAAHAALVQLLVPVMAAFAGVVFLGERLSLRLVVAAFLILGGIGLAVNRFHLPAFIYRRFRSLQ